MSSWCKVVLLGLLLSVSVGHASDHDDGEADLKGRALNLTDLYAFREDKEISGGSNAHLVFLMNSNPRSLPRQQYYFSTKARYELHISRAGTSKAVAATTADNIIIRFEFGTPDSGTLQQPITMTTVIDGVSKSYTTKDGGGGLYSTSLAGSATPVVADVTAGGNVLKVFAGLRKDPFFFDVTSFFRFRQAAAGNSGGVPVPGFAAFPTYTPDGVTASDFTANYNVNTIGLRVPIAFLQKNADTVFDTWMTVSVPQ